MSLTNKVALVTGAGQGIGKTFAEVLLKRGAKVCLVDLNEKTGEVTASEFEKHYGQGTVVFVKCNVTNEEELKAAFETVKASFGRLDIVVNNAGIADEKNWENMLEINLAGVIRGTKLAVDAMSQRPGEDSGLVINVASLAGLNPVPMAPVYCASKHGVVGFTRCMAELAAIVSMKIRFACLCPGFTATELLKGEHITLSSYKVPSAMVDSKAVMPLSQVAEAFGELLNTADNNGAVMTVTLEQGIDIRRREAWKPDQLY